MECERSSIKVLIVDHDERSLVFLANILMAWQYRVMTATNAHQALAILRENQGLFDIIISEFYRLGMDGFEFQKQIKNEFMIPIILMSSDNRANFISKTKEYGAIHYILKPFGAEDFKDIWKYALEAKNERLFVESLLTKGEEQDPSTNDQPKIKRKYCKRKIDEPQRKDGDVVKKPKLVWTTYLHNLFILAIKQIGLDKAVPKKILEIMNVPNLTRENVASHLQKYRTFLRDVAEKGMVGGISHRALRSRFASSLPVSVIKEIEEIRSNKIREPTLQYLNAIAYQRENERNNLNAFNNFPSNNVGPFPYIKTGLTIQDLDKVRLEKSNLDTNFVVENNITHDQNRFGISSSNFPIDQAKNSFNNGASTTFSSYGGGQGSVASSSSSSSSSSSFLARDFKFGDTSHQNNAFNHGVKNWNLGSLRSSNNLSPNVTCDASNNNPLGIPMNNRQEMVGIGTINKRDFESVGMRGDNANNNNFGFNGRGQNVNMNSGSLVNENSSLVQGGFETKNNGGFESVGMRGDNANNNNFGFKCHSQNVNMNSGSLVNENLGLVQGGFGTKNNGEFGSVSIRGDIANNNNLGYNVGGQNANMKFGSLANENFGLAQGGFGTKNNEGFGSVSISGDIANNNNLGYNVGGQNANMKFGSLVNENFGLAQGEFGTKNNEGFGSVSIRGDIANNNNIGYNVGGQNANMKFGSLVNENFGLAQGEFGTKNNEGFGSVSIRGDIANNNNLGYNVGGQNANMKFGSLVNENFGLAQEGFGTKNNEGFGSVSIRGDIANNNNIGYNVGGQNANMKFGSLVNENFGLAQGEFGTKNNEGFGSVSIRGDIANNNNIGYNVGGQNTNMKFGSLVNENFGLAQGGFGLSSLSDVRGKNGSEFQSSLVNNRENVLENKEIPPSNFNGNVVEHEQKFNASTSINEVDINQMKHNISNYLMDDDFSFPNEMNVNHYQSGTLKSTHFNSPQEEKYKGGDGISPQTEVTSCVLNDSPISSNHNSNQVEANEGFSNEGSNDGFMNGKVCKASTLAAEPELDMDILEELFGILDD